MARADDRTISVQSDSHTEVVSGFWVRRRKCAQQFGVSRVAHIVEISRSGVGAVVVTFRGSEEQPVSIKRNFSTEPVPVRPVVQHNLR